jgi:hypothetical protein
MAANTLRERGGSMKIEIAGTTRELKVLHINAKCSDFCYAELKDENGHIVATHDGYVPGFMPGKHYGDYVQLDIDIETGKLLNWKKPSAAEVEKEITEKEWEL